MTTLNFNNAADYLTASHETKVKMFDSMCKAITDIYKKKAKTTAEPPVLPKLYDKLQHMVFNLYSPQSVKGFLTRIATKPIKVISKPNTYGKKRSDFEQEDVYGKGHFRWDFKAYTLDENEVEALRVYLGVHVKKEAQKRTNKELAAAPKPDFEKITDYKEQAEAFLNWTGTKFSAEYKEHGTYFDDDKDSRDIYNITLRNSRHKFRFTFGQSIAGAGTTPTPYDILACLTKYEVEDFENFCSEFGYEQDSRKAYKTYKAVKREWENIDKLFTDEELELLREIQ